MSEALAALGFDGKNTKNQTVALNTLPWGRSEIVKPPGSSTYALAEGDSGLLNMKAASAESTASIKEIRKDVYELTNHQFRVEIDEGVITSLFDRREKREIIPKGKKANQLVIFDDKPLYWQAWDVEVYHLESRKELKPSKWSIAEDGPHRVSVVIETKISDQSWIKTTISLSATVNDQPSYIEMASEVEWHESMKFLKVEFPVDIVNQEASYETQFGIVRRPTHYNTTWDMAKFEVCCHKWADLSESGYGVSILNDSKYGFATCGNLMRLSLLRAPKAPDAHADMGKSAPNHSFATTEILTKNPFSPGRHHIRYAILPHTGPVGAPTVRTAFNFNHPLKYGAHPDPSGVAALLSTFTVTGSDALVLDTVKRGEDDEDVSRGGLPKRAGRSVVLRVYDALGGRARGRIGWGGKLRVKKVFKTNLLEDDGEELVHDEGGVEVELRPFEVATFRLQL